jgi:hypothetical protein
MNSQDPRTTDDFPADSNSHFPDYFNATAAYSDRISRQPEESADQAIQHPEMQFGGQSISFDQLNAPSSPQAFQQPVQHYMPQAFQMPDFSSQIMAQQAQQAQQQQQQLMQMQLMQMQAAQQRLMGAHQQAANVYGDANYDFQRITELARDPIALAENLAQEMELQAIRYRARQDVRMGRRSRYLGNGQYEDLGLAADLEDPLDVTTPLADRTPRTGKKGSKKSKLSLGDIS